jgi:hypothetical protein
VDLTEFAAMYLGLMTNSLQGACRPPRVSPKEKLRFVTRCTARDLTI